MIIFSFFLISAFRGSKYVLIFVSNHIAVFHSLLPIFAVTFNRPQPSSSDLRASLISFANFSGSDTKYQPAGPVNCQGFAVNSYFIPTFFILCKEVSMFWATKTGHTASTG